MLKQILIAATLCGATSIAATAHADSTPVELLQGKLNAYAKESVDLFDSSYENAYRLDSDGKVNGLDPAQCTAAIAAAKKAGVTANDQLADYWILQIHPKKQERDGNKFIVFSDAPWICENHAAALQLKRAAIAAKEAAASVSQPRQKPEDVSGNLDIITNHAKRCQKIVDEVAAVVGDKDVTVQGKKYKLSGLGDAFCAPAVAAAEAYVAKVKEVRAAKAAEISAKYEKLGVKGDRLALFIEYDNVYFRGKKCEIIDDIKKLVKAKYVYQWLENSDYTHTIRKYTFKGDKYKVSEKTYNTEAKAYKGCK